MIQSSKYDEFCSDDSFRFDNAFKIPTDGPPPAISTLIEARQNVSPRRLDVPGPTSMELEKIFQAAAAAPDHGRKGAWRYIVIPPDRRQDLGDAFLHALLERDPCATLEQIQSAKEKAFRAPFLFLVVVNLGLDVSGIPVFERLISTGAGIQNCLLVAQSMGFGCGLSSGRSITSLKITELFSLTQEESPICFVSIGTVAKIKKPSGRRTPQEFVSSL